MGGGLPGGGGAVEGGAGVGGALLEDGTLPVAAASIGGGSVGAAAGIGALAASDGAGDSREPGAGSQPQGAPVLMDAEDASAGDAGGEPPNGAPTIGGPAGGARLLPTTMNVYINQVDNGLGAADVWDDILPENGATWGHPGATHRPETVANPAPVEAPETVS